MSPGMGGRVERGGIKGKENYGLEGQERGR